MSSAKTAPAGNENKTAKGKGKGKNKDAQGGTTTVENSGTEGAGDKGTEEPAANGGQPEATAQQIGRAHV